MPSRADLRKAKIIEANLSGAILRGADLQDFEVITDEDTSDTAWSIRLKKSTLISILSSQGVGDEATFCHDFLHDNGFEEGNIRKSGNYWKLWGLPSL